MRPLNRRVTENFAQQISLQSKLGWVCTFPVYHKLSIYASQPTVSVYHILSLHFSVYKVQGLLLDQATICTLKVSSQLALIPCFLQYAKEQQLLMQQTSLTVLVELITNSVLILLIREQESLLNLSGNKSSYSIVVTKIAQKTFIAAKQP